MRIAIAEVGQETCSFTPVRTTVHTFRQYGLYEGAEILAVRQQDRGTLAGFFASAQNVGVDLTALPIISGWAGANGMLTAEALAFFEEKVVTGLQQIGPIDGLFFSLHGAAAAENNQLMSKAHCLPRPDETFFRPRPHHGNRTRRNRGLPLPCSTLA